MEVKIYFETLVPMHQIARYCITENSDSDINSRENLISQRASNSNDANVNNMNFILLRSSHNVLKLNA
jgi:hypothetical protein